MRSVGASTIDTMTRYDRDYRRKITAEDTGGRAKCTFLFDDDRVSADARYLSINRGILPSKNVFPPFSLLLLSSLFLSEESLPRRYSDIKTPYPLPRLIPANGNASHVDFRDTSPSPSPSLAVPSRTSDRPSFFPSSHFTFRPARFICRNILQSRKSTVISDPSTRIRIVIHKSLWQRQRARYRKS